jgi:adenylosuccinate synthase
LDTLTLRYAAWLNGLSAIAVTKLDVLDSFEKIKVCTAYRFGDQVITDIPDTIAQSRATPVYEELPGWKASTHDARTWSALPPAAQSYLRRIEELVGVPIRYVSVGAHRDQMIVV